MSEDVEAGSNTTVYAKQEADQGVGQGGDRRRSPPRFGGWKRVAAVVALVALADLLFFAAAGVGLSAAVFLLALVTGTAALNRGQLGERTTWGAMVLLAVALVPVIYGGSVSAIVIAGFAAAHLALCLARVATGDAVRDALRAIGLAFAGPVMPLIHMIRLHVARARGGWLRGGRFGRLSLAAWLVPLVLGTLFVLLFREANPMIEAWLADLSPGSLLREIDFGRVLLWGFCGMVAWPFVHARLFRGRAAWRAGKVRGAIFGAMAMRPTGAALQLETSMFGPSVILRSLVLFNLLFGVQTVLDLAYLWGGAALPDGMSYAEYAHRGAYPLILTALLAAAYVVVAMRPGSASAQSPAIRIAVYLWVAQNVLLAVSSILRLELYVEAYALTYLRVAAFVWMGLVAAGLVLIVARIVFDLSTGWLVGANLAALVLTLYVCGFVNFPSVIANYNVDHSREVSGEGRPLDLGYLESLGPEALPALERFDAATSIATVSDGRQSRITGVRIRLVTELEDSLDDWRAWTVRLFLTQAYVEVH